MRTGGVFFMKQIENGNVSKHDWDFWTDFDGMLGE